MAANKAETKARDNPRAWLNSNRKIRYKPRITIKPKNNSITLIDFLLTIGSRILVHNEVVAMPARHTEAVDILAELKNNIQCAEIIKPVAISFKMLFESTSIFDFIVNRTISNPAEAIRVRKKTNSSGGILINKPSIAVNPHNTITKWR